MERNYYIQQLYPLQDRFLRFFDPLNSGRFYLTGGTALGRFYLQHRYSDDLDFFSQKELNDFRDVVEGICRGAQKEGFIVETATVSDNFFRFFIKDKGVSLKIDFVNEGTFHFEGFQQFPLFSFVDNQMNILANKIGCVSRCEVKDMADIAGLARSLSFSWREVFAIAEKKSPVDPVQTSQIIKTLPLSELKLVKWIKAVHMEQIYADLQIIAQDILLGAKNSLTQGS